MLGALETTLQAFDGGSPATLGLLTQKTNPNGESVSYSYDAGGRVLTETYAGDNGLRLAKRTSMTGRP